MIAIVLMALAAGCASALMFASIVSGALISLLLFYLAPLPLMVAALGWGPLGASIGGIAAAIGIGAIFSFHHCIAFVVTVALPAWWLGHLVLLGRPATGGAPVPSDNAASSTAPLEWYPTGRILLWLSGFAALTTMAALLTLGSDSAAIANALRRGLLLMIGPRDTSSTGDVDQLVGQLVDAFVAIAPAAAGVFTMMTLTLNLWLAAKITAMSGRLQRPWPDLKSVALPPMTLAALSVAIAFCFIGGMAAIPAKVFTAALLTTYTLMGFAVLHLLTLALKGRVLWLGCAYAIIVIFVWPAVAVAALGLADAVFGIRQRYLRGRPPPVPTS